MADARILSIQIPVASGNTNFQIQFSDDQEDWTTLLVANVSNLVVADLPATRLYAVDGVNASADSATSNVVAASTPPMWYRVRTGTYSAPNYTWSEWADPFIIPSREDFLLGMKRQLKDPSIDGDYPALLNDADYRLHLANAVAAFEKTHPRLAAQNFTLTTDNQTYSLPDLWSTRFSRIMRVEYPSGSTPKIWVPNDYATPDNDMGTWTFTRISPSLGEYARIYYTVRHGRSGKTIPPAYFESVLMWACGDAAQQLRARHNQMGNPYIGSDVTDIDPRIREWGKIATEYKAQAETIWGRSGTGIRSHIDSFDDHGRIPQIVYSL